MAVDSGPICCWCGIANDLELADFDAKVANPQVDFAHQIYRCNSCKKLTAEARWGNQQFVYKALAYPRAFRSPIYVLVYEIVCSWCGRGDLIEPEDINATVGNPASARHHYDIYACHACDHFTAVSYLGQVFAYPAIQDERYPSMYYLEVGEEES
jgi:hypothetical protein